MRALAVLPRLVATLLLLAFVGWGAMAIWYDGPAAPLGGVLAAAFAVACIGLLAAVRPWRRGFVLALVACFALTLWWLSIPPSNDRDWLPDVAVPPTAEVEGNRLIVHNVRDCDYRSETDYTVRLVDRTYDLSQIQGLDLFLVYWGSPMIAHTILSWDFGGGQHLAISIETRKEKGETYSAVGGFFRQYELYYVVADERDVVRLRTNYRGEQVYLYRLKTPPDRARDLLLDYVKRIDELAREPKWYNALTQNCTTTIVTHVHAAGGRNLMDWRVLANGYIDQLLYELGSLDRSLPFDELRARSYVNERAKAAGDDPAFSERIREGLPPR